MILSDKEYFLYPPKAHALVRNIFGPLTEISWREMQYHATIKAGGTVYKLFAVSIGTTLFCRYS